MLVSLTLTGCGSTLKRSDSPALAGGTGSALNNLGGGTTGQGGVPASTTGGVTNPLSGSTGGTASGATGGATSGGLSAGSTGGSGSTSGSGVVPGQPKTTPIKIGIITVDTTAFASQFGATGTDTTKPVKDFVNYLNKTGGFAGRKIVPTFYKVDGTKDPNTASQEACETFKDAKDEIVMNSGGGDILVGCLARAGIVFLDTNVLAYDEVDVNRFRNRLLPNAMRFDRLYPADLSIAAQRGLVKKGDVVGILREDCIWGQRIMKNTMLPLAAQLGVKVVEGTHRCIQNLATDLAPITSDIQREVLRFQQQGVKAVIGLSTAEAFVLSRFSQTASQQQYHPKYLVTSQAYPYTNSRDGATISISKDALPNIYGVGYLQMWDVGDNTAVPPLQAQARARCKQAEPTQGGASGRTDNQYYFLRQAFWAACDGFFALRAILEATHGDSSLNAMLAGYHVALGHGKLVSAGLTGGYFEVTATRLDGAGYLRPFSWNAAKNTFLYSAPPTAIP